MNARRGVSMTEMMVVMTACTALLSLGAVLLHRTMHEHGKARSFFDAQRSGLRLGEQFRDDVHVASAINTKDLPQGVVAKLTLSSGQTVDYRAMDGVVERSTLTDGQTKSREQFAFPSTSEITVEQSDSIVTLSIENDPPKPSDPHLATFATSVHVHVEARLGRDLQSGGRRSASAEPGNYAPGFADAKHQPPEFDGEERR